MTNTISKHGTRHLSSWRIKIRRRHASGYPIVIRMQQAALYDPTNKKTRDAGFFVGESKRTLGHATQQVRLDVVDRLQAYGDTQQAIANARSRTGLR